MPVSSPGHGPGELHPLAHGSGWRPSQCAAGVFVLLTFLTFVPVAQYHSHGGGLGGLFSGANDPAPAQPDTESLSRSQRPPRRRGVVMSCPVGGAAHNPGSWKPTPLWLGVQGVARQLERLGSALELVVVMYPHEVPDAEPQCRHLQIEHPKLRVHCFEMPIEFPKGYGVSKVMAIQHAPLDQVVWLDCDTFPTRDLEYLFEDPEFARTGAMFWPDVEGHYHVERATGEGQLFDNAGVDQALFPYDAWWTTQGFDSGVILIDKAKAAGPMARVTSMAEEFEEKWEQYTSGDKDLWHLAWTLHGVNFTLVPYVGAIGCFSRAGTWLMASQAKFDHGGEIAVLHQLWRPTWEHRYDGEGRFGQHAWDKLAADNLGKRYNVPESTIRIDVRLNPHYKYSRENSGKRTQAEEGVSDWDLMKANLSISEMFASAVSDRAHVDKMSQAWRY